MLQKLNALAESPGSVRKLPKVGAGQSCTPVSRQENNASAVTVLETKPTEWLFCSRTCADISVMKIAFLVPVFFLNTASLLRSSLAYFALIVKGSLVNLISHRLTHGLCGQSGGLLVRPDRRDRLNRASRRLIHSVSRRCQETF
jgi:hypothetical protein